MRDTPSGSSRIDGHVPLQSLAPAHPVRRAGNQAALVSTRTHEIIDFFAASLFIGEFILAPRVFLFAEGTASEWALMLIGICIVAAILLTDYGRGGARPVPMPVHLGFDVAAGILIAVLPFLPGASEWIMLPCLLFGAFMVLLGFLSSAEAGRPALL